jgi:diacylglycerol kinase family enzyme
MAIISPAGGAPEKWANRIEKHLASKHRTVFRLTLPGESGLTDVIKEARRQGAHRVMAVGTDEFVRWSAQAMVGSLMPLAPALVPGSRSLFGHRALGNLGWENKVEQLLLGTFLKVDLAMGTSQPIVHQLVAGFPIVDDRVGWHPFKAAVASDLLDLSIEVDRTQVEGPFWCLVVANADFPQSKVRWIPGSNWTDQCLDLMLVRPRPFWQRVQFLRAVRKGTHGGLPGVIRFRGHRITVHAGQAWRYSADGGPVRNAADPLVLEAKPQKLRLVVPEAK